jgi:hypothetical protein
MVGGAAGTGGTADDEYELWKRNHIDLRIRGRLL